MLGFDGAEPEIVASACGDSTPADQCCRVWERWSVPDFLLCSLQRSNSYSRALTVWSRVLSPDWPQCHRDFLAPASPRYTLTCILLSYISNTDVTCHSPTAIRLTWFLYFCQGWTVFFSGASLPTPTFFFWPMPSVPHLWQYFSIAFLVFLRYSHVFIFSTFHIHLILFWRSTFWGLLFTLSFSTSYFP